MTPRTKHWLKFSIRWGIAVVGITWVLWSITFRDRVTVLTAGTNLPQYAQVLDNAGEDQASVEGGAAAGHGGIGAARSVAAIAGAA